MLRFPIVKPGLEPKMPKMGLRDYARYCELCLKSNPAITPQNCMVQRDDERLITRPFVLR